MLLNIYRIFLYTKWYAKLCDITLFVLYNTYIHGLLAFPLLYHLSLTPLSVTLVKASAIYSNMVYSCSIWAMSQTNVYSFRVCVHIKWRRHERARAIRLNAQRILYVCMYIWGNGWVCMGGYIVRGGEIHNGQLMGNTPGIYPETSRDVATWININFISCDITRECVRRTVKRDIEPSRK